MALTLDQLVSQAGSGVKAGGNAPLSLDELIRQSGSPTAENQQFKIQRLKNAEQTAKANATYANSLGGIIRNTITGLPSASGIPQAYQAGKQKTDQSTESFLTDTNPLAKAGDLGEAFTGAAEQVSSPFAPVSNILGYLINGAANYVSDNKALQGFATSPAGNITAKIVSAINDASIVGTTILGGLDAFRSAAGVLKTPEDLAIERTSNTSDSPQPVEEASARPPLSVPEEIPHPVTETPVPESKSVSSPEPTTVKPIVQEPTVLARTAKASADISNRLAQQGFDAIPFEDQAKYTPSTKAEQIAKVSEITMNDMERATRIALGKEPVPPDIHPQVIFNAVEAHALKNGDSELLRGLAASPIAQQLSEHAQALGSHGFNDNPNSPVEAIREVQRVRADSIKKTVAVAKVKTVTAVRKAIRQTHTVETWSDFVKSIEC